METVMDMPYQYAQHFTEEDQDGAYIVHPSEWISVRLHETNDEAEWEIATLPAGIVFDGSERGELSDAYTSGGLRIFRFRVDEAAPQLIGEMRFTRQREGLPSEDFTLGLQILPG